jgi:hypothetical protein
MIRIARSYNVSQSTISRFRHEHAEGAARLLSQTVRSQIIIG